MSLNSVLQPGVSRRELLAWMFYDFANSGYTTVVITAVYSAYFVAAIAGNADWASLAWTGALGLSSLLVMITMPVLGAWADEHGRRGLLLKLSTAGCVLGTAALAWVGPQMLFLAILLIVVSNYFFTVGESTVAAYLPELARPEAIGRVSGWGWGIGYFGGMLTLGLSLVWVLGAPSRGQTAGEAVPVTMLITATVFALAALPSMLILRERAGSTPRVDSSGTFRMRTAFSRMGQIWREASGLPDLRQMLILGALYQAGISVVIALAAVYAQQVMGFSEVQTMTLIFTVNIAAAAGAFGFGHVQDHVGHRTALAATLFGWIVVTLLAGLGQTAGIFWVAAALAGLCMGSSQSAGRAMLGRLAPDGRFTEYYGLWAFAGRVAAIVGPVSYGLVTWLSGGEHRWAILGTSTFFVAALVVLVRIDIERGALAARRLARGVGQ
jgi:UMF1 family MFS transporter